MKLTSFLGAAAACAYLTSPAFGQGADDWTWIFGELNNPKQQQEYAAFSDRVFQYIQDGGEFKGVRVLASELESLPETHTAIAGPVAAIGHPEWFGPTLQVTEAGGIRLAGVEFDAPRTGIFLRSEDATQLIYTGLSVTGWIDIFSTPTGTPDCTIVIEGIPRYEGYWVNGTLELEPRAFLPTYPSVEKLEHLGKVQDYTSFRNVYGDRDGASLTPEFEEGLKHLVKGRRVLFVGETHWNVEVNQLFNRMLEFLLEHKTPRMVFLELNYSFSAHFEFYVGLGDDADAALFLEEEMHPLVSAPTELATLDILRRWNREHPDRAVSVGCLDMEWHTDKTLKQVIVPFFAALDPPCKVSGITQIGKQRWLSTELVRLRARLADETQAPDSMPFLDPGFIAEALTNLEDTLSLGANRGERRQQHIVRNIVDFHGEKLDAGFALFKGGGFHAQKNIPVVNGTYRDAAYLHQVHESTKGRVASIQLQGVAYSLAPFVGIDLRKRIKSADNYTSLVGKFRRDLEQGYASVDDYFLMNGRLSSLESFAARAGYDRSQNALWLEGADLRALNRAYGFDAQAEGWHNYDTRVFLMRSDLEPTRLLVPEKD